MRRRIDMMKYDPEARQHTVSYPWSVDVCKLTDNYSQAVAFQTSVERRLLKNRNLAEVCNALLRKLIYIDAKSRLTQEEIDAYFTHVALSLITGSASLVRRRWP